MRARWLIVLLTAAVLVATPLVSDARPAAGSSLSAPELASRIQSSAAVGWSGFVQSTGTLAVPESDSFAGLAPLLGENNALRVWWRDAEHWRIDRIRGTGETDLFRRGSQSVRWVFESETATISPVSEVRLPDASDLLPPTLARSLLQGARATELTTVAPRRVAGVDAAGLRLTPDEADTTVDHVDVWADPDSGLAVEVQLYGRGDRLPVLGSSMADLRLEAPAPASTEFTAPASVTLNYDESVDVAAAANAFAPYDLPRALGGLPSRSGDDPGAVGVYGRGATTLIAFPLRGQVAWPLRQRLQTSAASRETAVGTLAPVGPVGLLVTRDEGDGGGFLLAGTVGSETLQRAAAQLLEGQ